MELCWEIFSSASLSYPLWTLKPEYIHKFSYFKFSESGTQQYSLTPQHIYLGTKFKFVSSLRLIFRIFWDHEVTEPRIRAPTPQRHTNRPCFPSNLCVVACVTALIHLLWPMPTPWSFDSALELSWCIWVCHFACWLRIKVYLDVILVPFDSNLYVVSLGYVILSKVVPCQVPSCYSITASEEWIVAKILRVVPTKSWKLVH